jgi:RHS repeat-associated protein
MHPSGCTKNRSNPNAANKGEVYYYDAADQLTNVVYDVNSPTNSPTGGTNDTRYVIDDAGNFVTNRVINGATTNMTTFVADAANQYTSVNGTNHTYASGCLTNDGVWSYKCDCEDRLMQARKSGVTVEYVYDAFGRMIQRTADVGPVKTRRYWYDGWQIVEEHNGPGDMENRYVYGTGINEVARYTKADGVNRYFTYDGLGSMTEVTGGDGNLHESYTYDVYGTPMMYNVAGSVTNVSVIGNRLLFTGRDRDVDTVLYNNRFRWYSPTLGRFIQPDPIGLAGGDLNLYRYCRNNPVNWVDPWGLDNLSLLPPDDLGKIGVDQNKLNPNEYSVRAHGRPGQVYDSNKNPISVDRLAEMIKKDPNYKGQPIRLNICNAGTKKDQTATSNTKDPSVGESLSKKLKTTVHAPTGRLESEWSAPPELLFLGEKPSPMTETKRILDNGKWEVFKHEAK